MNSTDEIKENLTGAVILLALLMVTGVIGNLHILLVYIFRRKPSNNGIFIIFLSVLDEIACVFLIPLHMNAYINFGEYGNDFMCKVGKPFTFFVLDASTSTLLLVALDRYRKICCPLGWQIKRRDAKLLCLGGIIFSVFTSLPIAVVNESKTFQHNNVTITTCSIIERSKTFHLYYRIVLLIIFFASSCILVGFYFLIFRATAKLDARVQVADSNEQCLPNKGKANAEQSAKTEANVAAEKKNEQCSKTGDTSLDETAQDDELQNLGNVETEQVQNHRLTECSTKYISAGKRNISKKTKKRSKMMTIIFTLITLFYFVSFAPFVGSEIFLVHRKLIQSKNLYASTFIAISITRSLIYVNSVANCFIYSCFNCRFRREVAAMYRTFWRMCRH